jgi:hypothetical protein
MMQMTAISPELIVGAVLADEALRSFVQVIVVVCVVAVLAEREMVRHWHRLWARAAVPSLTAIAIPLVIAWGFLALERFIELAGIGA